VASSATRASEKPNSGSSFHNGVDISAPNGTPAYAVAAGTVSVDHFNVSVVSSGGVEHGYQHVQPKVKSGDEVACSAL
jgi:murein DD-endopeptidase MepM/ murein hydrolase activator NlpD